MGDRDNKDVIIDAEVSEVSESSEYEKIVEEEQIRKENKKSFLGSTIVYGAVFLLGSSFILIAFLGIYAYINQLDMSKLYEVMLMTEFDGIELEYIKANAVIQGWSNFLTYLVCAILIFIFNKKILERDWKKIKGKAGKFSLYCLITSVAFLGITLVVEILIGLIPGSDVSVNQATIELIMSNGGAIPMCIAVVLFAPFVEEIVFRKVVFNIMKKYGKPACYAVSIILFTIPHMISTDMSNFGIWLIQCIPYALSGYLLCLVYDKSEENIYSSICVHLVNNLFACILMFI